MEKDFTPATKEMLQQAAAGELVLFASARRHTAKLHAFPWAVAPKQSNRSCADGFVPIMPQLANGLLAFANAQLKMYLATDPSDCPDAHPWKDHYWVLDEPQTITREQIYSVAHLMPANAPAAVEQAAPDVPKRQRKDALAVELDEILVSMKTRTPAKVMAKLREQIVKPNTCILRNVGDGIEWKNDCGEVKILTISNLGERIREWKKTGLSQG